MMNAYVAGNTIRLLVSFSNGGVAYDPSAVVFSVLGPESREVAQPIVVKDASGNYHADYVAADPGVYQIRVAATNPDSAGEDAFLVKDSDFA